jgi:hypothetical protein
VRHLITTIRQIGGGVRELYAPSERSAREAREQIRRDPALLDCVDVSEYVDVDADGSRRRYVR